MLNLWEFKNLGSKGLIARPLNLHNKQSQLREYTCYIVQLRYSSGGKVLDEVPPQGVEALVVFVGFLLDLGMRYTIGEIQLCLVREERSPLTGCDELFLCS